MLTALLAPIPGPAPAGADLALAPELDAIRALRRGDGDDLAQGDWVREQRGPQWAQVRDHCRQVLEGLSKDLQVACWLAEAQARVDGLEGLAEGLDLVAGLLDRFWDTCHPTLATGGAEARAGRLEWLDLKLAQTVRQLPVTRAGHTWLQREEALAVENQALRGPEARDQAIQEGRLAPDVFQKAALASGAPFYVRLQAGAEAALAALGRLQAVLEQRLGEAAPGLEALAAALQACREGAGQIRRRWFPEAAEAPAPEPPAGTGPAQPPSRVQAIARLRSAAAYFRSAEPHSPVALLAERAAAWAEMPLEAWLAEVVKDAPTLSQLRELLAIKALPE